MGSKNSLLDNMGKGGWVYKPCLVYSCNCTACAFGYSGPSENQKQPMSMFICLHRTCVIVHVMDQLDWAAGHRDS